MGGNTLKTYMMLRGGDDDRRDDGRIDNRFRDRTGREHYDNGRFAPMRSEYDGGMNMNYNRTNMGYTEPVRMGGYDHDMDARRSWEIIENNGPHMEPRYDGDYNRDGMRRVMGFGGSSYVDHPRMHEMTHRSGEKMPGHASTKSMPVLTREMAEYWMENLQNEDGTKGPHWSLEDVKNIIKQRSLQVDPIRLWVGMNAEYSDNVMVNRKYGVDKQEYYLESAIAKWLNDKDAVDDKEAAYFMHVVKH
ncbi:MAG: hypothetical protein IIX72_00575 [Oscillospiraceae bacterium]|nr:hypothetical protein [Oscillospiraceae bacterium]